MYLIPAYKSIYKPFRLPSKDNLLEAASALIGLSNGVFKSPIDLVNINLERAKRIRTILGIYNPKSD